MFFKNQPLEQQKQYIKLLQVVGSLSNLFSDSKTPYLYYRAAENIFCKALEANNLSRGDISFDAFKGDIGIGLKTFIHAKGTKYEKVAEFNKDIDKFRFLDDEGIMKKIAELRNNRIGVAERAHGTKKMIYHLVTRKDGKFEIHEEEMHYIHNKTLKLDKKKTSKKTIFFKDKYCEYKFSISKSTLFKKFICNNPIEVFDIDILDDPFEFLLNEQSNQYYMVHEQEEQFEHIYLPLYSAKNKDVMPRSGLNAWNADDSNRPRKPNEVYIPIPSWIHKQFEGFFPYNRHTGAKKSFELVLPDNKTLSASICQKGGKGFMSNPNKDLGKWILRKVLQVPEYQVVTYDDLDRIGIDSVIVTKLDEFKFKINFASTGSYADFEEEFKK
jgi:hypothetical protein